MDILRRNRLECFYCGCRSAQKRKSGLQQWECEKCEAVNHLDENGEITDPPPLENSSSAQYARSIPHSTSPVFSSPDEDLFCSTCIKNQHLYTQSLASYLPSPTDPNFPAFENYLPTHRKNLEERYPQVCEDCEPRVRNRIRSTGYAAKTEHLRRMMERSRGAALRYYSWGWKDAIVFLGGQIWWMSIAIQVLANFLGALSTPSEHDGLRDENATPQLSNVWQAIQSGQALEDYNRVYPRLAGLAVILAILSLWWNPRLQHRIKGQGGRIIGLGEYYKLQAISIAVRIAIWVSLGKDNDTRLTPPPIKALHSFLLVFNLMCTFASFQSVKIDYSPRISFQESNEPLIPPKASNQSFERSQSRPTQPRSNTTSLNEKPQSLSSLYSAANRTTLSQGPFQPRHDMLTPPPEEEGDNQMDWTPEGPLKQPLQPNVSHRLQHSPPPNIQPSPFYGRIPPAPVSQAHQLRNPPNQPRFRKASSLQQQNFSNQVKAKRSNSYDEDDTDYDPPTPTTVSSSPRLGMAPPRFFPPSDLKNDTGLESIFDSTFTLQDGPPEVRASQGTQQPQRIYRKLPATLPSPWQRVMKIIMLLFACLALSVVAKHPRFGLHLRFSALGVAAMVSGTSLSSSMQTSKAFWNVSDILLFALELAMSIFLGSAVKSSIQTGVNAQSTSQLSMWLLGVMTLQEILMFGSEMRTSRQPLSNSTHANPQTSTRTPSYDSLAAKSLAITNQELPTTSQTTNNPSQAQIHQPRTTRSKSKRESFVPSTTLSGLSLGPRPEPPNTGGRSQHSSWSKTTEFTPRSTRSTGRNALWGA